MPTAPDRIALGIPADTLRQRPDVRAAEFTLKAEIARSAQREASSTSLSGAFDWKAFSLGALGGSASIVRSLAAGLSAPLFDAGRIGSRIAVQNAIQERGLDRLEKTLLTALEDVENALTAYAAGRRACQRPAAGGQRRRQRRGWP